MASYDRSRHSRSSPAAFFWAAWLLLLTGAGLWTEIHRIQTPLTAWMDRAATLLGLGRGE
jgi:hypothetical protein